MSGEFKHSNNDRGGDSVYDTEIGRSAVSTLENMRQYSASETDRRYAENAEMKLVQAIHDHEGLHVIGLAEVLGITKGAVSQTLAKLEKKGLVYKEKDPDNASRLNIFLSNKGSELYDAHARYHQELDALTEELIKAASPESVAFLRQFLEKINAKLGEEWIVLEKYLAEEKSGRHLGE